MKGKKGILRWIAGVLLAALLTGCATTGQTPGAQSGQSQQGLGGTASTGKTPSAAPAGEQEEPLESGGDLGDSFYGDLTGEQLYAEISKKYGEKEEASYGEPISQLGRNERMELQLGYKPNLVQEVCGLYWDAGLTQKLDFRGEFDEETQKLTLKPGPYGVALVATGELTTTQVRQFPHDAYALYSTDVYENWGNIGKFYQVIYVDLKTGEKLAQPLVQVVNLQGELEAPVLRFVPTESGLASFTWNEVPGAKAYVLCKIPYDGKKGFQGNAQAIALTTELSWTQEAPKFSSYSQTNDPFRSFKFSEDDWVGDRVYNKEGLTEGQASQDELRQSRYGVIALGESGTSMYSNLFTTEALSTVLPFAEASATSKANGFQRSCDDIGLAPSHVWVTLCDGKTARRLISYSIQEARVETNRYINVDADTGEYVSGEDVPVLQLPYTVEGAPFEYVLNITDYDKSTLDKDLALLQARQEGLKGMAGMPGPLLEESSQGMEGGNQILTTPESGIQVKATSPLSEYLATCMLGRNEMVSLTGMPGVGDREAIEDALKEAYYQNPLILGLAGYRLNKDYTKLKLTYEDDIPTAQKKQQEILDKVQLVAEEILTPAMTPLEKEMAINQYLIDTVSYDVAALEHAQANNYLVTDPNFQDSFTAYGALLKGKAVCAGYAGAFALLARAGGLDCLVVTGTLEGTIPHAWNKVLLGDTWEAIDTTNNDNEELLDALFNLPTSAREKTLVEDGEYLVEEALKKQTVSEGKQELYHVKKRFFPTAQVADQLAAELTEKGVSLLRTEYNITDQDFKTITDQVYEKLGDNVVLRGYFWLGVIRLEMEEKPASTPAPEGESGAEASTTTSEAA